MVTSSFNRVHLSLPCLLLGPQQIKHPDQICKLKKTPSYLLHRKILLVFLQRLLGVFKGLVCQLFLPLGVNVWLEGQVTGCTGQPPQKLCIIAA